uniref:Secreted protein n=1 Tax=Mycena chlorophos TaxID=658473 RepID=A0ABQ0LXY2_MYCCL|nr:predicted protein [Mycena chlorophos]
MLLSRTCAAYSGTLSICFTCSLLELSGQRRSAEWLYTTRVGLVIPSQPEYSNRRLLTREHEYHPPQRYTQPKSAP